ncbi:MAG: DUF4190 domain-containing protein [Burkholderiaceae bacterium]|nr:DUF4190 domain-containing protein [Microbacteriaceae bacterium]
MSDASSIPPYAAPAPVAPGGENPAKTLGIVALVLAIFLNIVGAIVGIVALRKSKKAGFPNGPALAAIIVGFVLFLVFVTFTVVAVIAVFATTGQIAAACEGASGQTITIGGQPFVCP